MTELTVPEGATERETARLVEEFVAVGDEVEVRRERIADADRIAAVGEVTGFEADEEGRGYLEIDGHPVSQHSVRYDEIRTVTKIDAG
ncbi:hypothetical protein [Salinilacihabitans rarus]|uniref:hypothetical protein n=1 Tax=Salinilacihabitans rarus TaxID=2961596 RepID=UPI0020C92922|nr:hypothetical protein [Salinilacihabitans rarus]